MLSQKLAGYKPNRFKDMPKGMNEEDNVEKEEETIEEVNYGYNTINYT